MEITCNIIKDLLPLYAEDLVSEDSKILVDDHLCTCDSCTKELAAIQKAPKVPLETDVKSLQNKWLEQPLYHNIYEILCFREPKIE